MVCLGSYPFFQIYGENKKKNYVFHLFISKDICSWLHAYQKKRFAIYNVSHRLRTTDIYALFVLR